MAKSVRNMVKFRFLMIRLHIIYVIATVLRSLAKRASEKRARLCMTAIDIRPDLRNYITSRFY